MKHVKRLLEVHKKVLQQEIECYEGYIEEETKRLNQQLESLKQHRAELKEIDSYLTELKEKENTDSSLQKETES